MKSKKFTSWIRKQLDKQIIKETFYEDALLYGQWCREWKDFNQYCENQMYYNLDFNIKGEKYYGCVKMS